MEKALLFLLYCLAAVGFIACNETIKRVQGARGFNLNDETGIDAEFVGASEYTSVQDNRWFI